MNANLIKRALCFLLTLALLVGYMPPVHVHAEETAPTEAVTEAATEAATENAEETAAPTQPAVPEETAAPTTPATEVPAVTEAAVSTVAEISEVAITSGTCGENVTWAFADSVLTISGAGAMADYTDIEVAPWTPYLSEIEKLVIGNGITHIGAWTFIRCENLTDVSFPSTVTTIGEFAFYSCTSLTELSLPENLVSIGEHTFAECSGLASITIPDSVTSIGLSAFSFCSALKEVTIGSGVKFIDGEAFCLCPLEKITFLGDAPEFGIEVFLSTTTTAYYPANNTTWTSDVMQNYGGDITWVAYTPESDDTEDVIASGTCGENLTWTLDAEGTLTISGSGAMDDYDDVGNRAPWYDYGTSVESLVIEVGVNSIGDSAFAYIDTITSVEIPNSVTSIGREAFANCYKLKEVTISNSVTNIGDAAFFYCRSLTSFEIPDSVTSIGNSEFAYCEGLKEVTIPNSVTTIGEKAFESCSSLKSIELPNSVISIGKEAFIYCDGLINIHIPDSVTSIGSIAFASCYKLKEVTIPNSVTDIGAGAFSGCQSLTSIEIPDSVTNIGQNVFANCEGLKEVTIPNSVTSIGEQAFGWCSNLTSIKIPNSVTSIGKMAFYLCNSLTNVEIPDSVVSIGVQAFANCGTLEEVSIGSGVTSIGSSAFSQCSSLKGIWVSDANTAYCNDDIGALFNKDMSELIRVPNTIEGIYWIPDSVTNIYRGAFAGCSSLTSIEIPDSVTIIGNSAFSNCSRLTSIVIPDRVTNIGAFAFSCCHSLTSIKIPDSVTNIESHTFDRCLSLESIEIPVNVTEISTSAFTGCVSLVEITFTGNCPGINSSAFNKVKATAYYPIDNPTWTADVLQNYGGALSWVAKCTNHSVDILPAVAPACAAEGLTEGSYCSKCSEVIVSQQPIPALGHSHEAEIISPTCTERGYTAYICHCGDAYTNGYVNALGHDVSQWETTKEATCTEDGEKRGDCSRCGLRTEIVKALGHKEVIDEAVAPTCTETGLTEGKHCSVCEEVLIAQEVIPATGHAFEPKGEGKVCAHCGLELHVRILQDFVSLDLQVFRVAQLQVEVSPAELMENIQWSIEGDEGVVTVDQTGVVSVLGVGSAHVVATATYGEHEVSTRCRIDVTETVQLEGVQLGTSTLTTELYSTNYAGFEILLQLPQNYPVAATTYSLRGRNTGVMMEAAYFADPLMAEMFEIVVLDDRSVLVIPTDFAVYNPKLVANKYTGPVAVVVQGKEYYSENLTLTVKKTMPKLKASVAAFNSFYSFDSKEIVITGATPTAIYADESKNTAKTTAIPNWLTLSGDTLTLTEDAPLKSASGKAYILVETEEWRIPTALTLSVKNTYKAPGLKLSASSVTLTKLAEESDGVTLKLICSNKKDTLDSLNVLGIAAPEGYIIENFNMEDGSFTLKAEEGFQSGKITLRVTFSNTDVTLPLTLTVKTAAVTTKLSAKSVKLNRAVSDSAVITVTTTPADYRLTAPTIRLTGTETVNGKKVTVDKLDSGELDVRYEDGQIKITTTANTPEKASYKLYVSAGGSKEAAATINVISAKPTVTLKAKGTMDLSFPNQTATITPAFKNYSGSIVSYDYHITEMKGKTVVNEDVSQSFSVEQEGKTFAIRCVDEEAVNTSNTYAVKLKLFLEDGSSLENTVNLRVKRTAVKLKLSSSKLSLNKLIDDEGSLTVACTTKGYDFDAPIWTLMDAKNNSAEGQLDISYADGKLTVGVNDNTSYGTTYKIMLKANEYGTASTLTVTVPTEAKSKITTSVKVSGKLDVIRDGSAITVTPSYKNCIASTKGTQELFIYSSADKFKEPVNELFSIEPNGKGGFTVTKAEGASLSHSLKYKVKLVTTFGNTKVESAQTSMSVIMGATRLTVGTDSTTLFAKDKNDRVVFWLEASDSTLNGAARVEIKDAKQREMFEILDYGDGVYAIGFKDGAVHSSLITKAAGKTLTLTLNVYLDGNQTTKPNTTVKVKVIVVK